MKPIYIIGSGGHARPVVDTALSLGHEIKGIVDLNFNEGRKENIFGVPVIGGIEVLQEINLAVFDLFLAIGDNEQRAHLAEELQERGWGFCSLVSPSAIISPHAKIEEGAFINAGSIINAGCHIGEHVIINTGAVIDHESEVAAFCHIGPGTSIAGRVKIGKYTFIGIGSTVIDHVNIGDSVTVGAGSIIIKDIPSGKKVIGVSKMID